MYTFIPTTGIPLGKYAMKFLSLFPLPRGLCQRVDLCPSHKFLKYFIFNAFVCVTVRHCNHILFVKELLLTLFHKKKSYKRLFNVLIFFFLPRTSSNNALNLRDGLNNINRSLRLTSWKLPIKGNWSGINEYSYFSTSLFLLLYISITEWQKFYIIFDLYHTHS